MKFAFLSSSCLCDKQSEFTANSMHIVQVFFFSEVQKFWNTLFHSEFAYLLHIVQLCCYAARLLMCPVICFFCNSTPEFLTFLCLWGFLRRHHCVSVKNKFAIWGSNICLANLTPFINIWHIGAHITKLAVRWWCLRNLPAQRTQITQSIRNSNVRV